jgi:ABC-type lipopolysaccharide export system ATPase subunit
MNPSNPLSKFKVQVTIVWMVVQGVLALLVQFGKLDPQMVEIIKQIMLYGTIVAGVVITGHTATDIMGIVQNANLMMQKSNLDSSANMTVLDAVRQFLMTNIGQVKNAQDVENVMQKIADKITTKSEQ